MRSKTAPPRSSSIPRSPLAPLSHPTASFAVRCVRPSRVGTRRRLRSGSTRASVQPSGARAARPLYSTSLVTSGSAYSQPTASTLSYTPGSPGLLFRGRGPPVQWATALGSRSRSRCPLIPQGAGLACCHALHPKWLTYIPCSPAFPELRPCGRAHCWAYRSIL